MMEFCVESTESSSLSEISSPVSLEESLSALDDLLEQTDIQLASIKASEQLQYDSPMSSISGRATIGPSGFHGHQHTTGQQGPLSQAQNFFPSGVSTGSQFTSGMATLPHRRNSLNGSRSTFSEKSSGSDISALALEEPPSPDPSFCSLGSEEVRQSLEELDAVIQAFDDEYLEVKSYFHLKPTEDDHNRKTPTQDDPDEQEFSNTNRNSVCLPPPPSSTNLQLYIEESDDFPLPPPPSLPGSIYTDMTASDHSAVTPMAPPSPSNAFNSDNIDINFPPPITESPSEDDMTTEIGIEIGQSTTEISPICERRETFPPISNIVNQDDVSPDQVTPRGQFQDTKVNQCPPSARVLPPSIPKRSPSTRLTQGAPVIVPISSTSCLSPSSKSYDFLPSPEVALPPPPSPGVEEASPIGDDPPPPPPDEKEEGEESGIDIASQSVSDIINKFKKKVVQDVPTSSPIKASPDISIKKTPKPIATVIATFHQSPSQQVPNDFSSQGKVEPDSCSIPAEDNEEKDSTSLVTTNGGVKQLAREFLKAADTLVTLPPPPSVPIKSLSKPLTSPPPPPINQPTQKQPISHSSSMMNKNGVSMPISMVQPPSVKGVSVLPCVPVSASPIPNVQPPSLKGVSVFPNPPVTTSPISGVQPPSVKGVNVFPCQPALSSPQTPHSQFLASLEKQSNGSPSRGTPPPIPQQSMQPPVGTIPFAPPQLPTQHRPPGTIPMPMPQLPARVKPPQLEQNSTLPPPMQPLNSSFRTPSSASPIPPPIVPSVPRRTTQYTGPSAHITNSDIVTSQPDHNFYNTTAIVAPNNVMQHHQNLQSMSYYQHQQQPSQQVYDLPSIPPVAHVQPQQYYQQPHQLQNNYAMPAAPSPVHIQQVQYQQPTSSPQHNQQQHYYSPPQPPSSTPQHGPYHPSPCLPPPPPPPPSTSITRPLLPPPPPPPALSRQSFQGSPQTQSPIMPGKIKKQKSKSIDATSPQQVPDVQAALIAQLKGGVKLRRSSDAKSQEETESPTFESPSSADTFQMNTSSCDNNNSSFNNGNTGLYPMPEINSSGFIVNGVDVREVPNYQIVPDSCPEWKKHLIERKNKEAMDAYLKVKAEEEQERLKWGNVPQWKRNLIEKKDMTKKKEDTTEVETKACPPLTPDDPSLANVPEWKRHLILKKTRSGSQDDGVGNGHS